MVLSDHSYDSHDTSASSKTMNNPALSGPPTLASPSIPSAPLLSPDSIHSTVNSGCNSRNAVKRFWMEARNSWYSTSAISVGGIRFDKSLVVLLLLIDAFVCGYVLRFIRYTEIDWNAYMEEVEFFLNGERDYYKMKGGTGPLVYPAGFVYIYSVLKLITGGDHAIGQIIFGFIYLVQIALILLIAQPTVNKDSLILSLVIFSKRLHSIYLLRCFNDGFAMTFTFASIYAAQKRQWIATCVLFSLGLSVKMNVLFYFPGLLWLLYDQASNRRILQTSFYLLICVLMQAILGLPFLLHHPTAYLHKAFEFGRVFQYRWTVNWKFIPESIFLSPSWSILLAAGHIAVLIVLWKRIWIRNRNLVLTKEVFQTFVAFVFYTSNFIGVFFCRSLHYQFYAWYFPTVPFLLCHIRGNQFFKVLLLASLEYCWNVYPQRAAVSLLLFAVHCTLLIGIVTSPLKDLWRREIVATQMDANINNRTTNKDKLQ